MSPEVRLLLCIARLEPDAARRAEIARLLNAPLDWPQVLALASAHGLVPLLYLHAQAIAPQAMPARAMAALWAAQEAIARRNRALGSELPGVVALLEGLGVACVPYKGPVLAETLYGEITLRSFSDLDILVRREDVTRAQAALVAAGYAPAYRLAPCAQRLLLRARTHYHLLLLHEHSGAAVELHWRTDPFCPVEALCPDLWTRPAVVSFAGRSVRSFRGDELLLALALHGSKHHWSSLGWLVDVAELVRRGGYDWDWIWHAADRLHARRRLALGLHLARVLLDCPLPDAVLAEIAACGIDGLAQQVCARLPHPQTHSALARAVLDFRLHDTVSDGLRAQAAMLLSPSLAELQAWPLPCALRLLYVPLRIGRLMAKYLGLGLSAAAAVRAGRRLGRLAEPR